MEELLNDIFWGGEIKFTLCLGKLDKGVTKSCRRINERFTWPGMCGDIKEDIRGCKSCLENN